MIWIKSLFDRNYVIAGYVLSAAFLLASGASAYRAFTAPVVIPDATAIPAVIPVDTSLVPDAVFPETGDATLRDPFVSGSTLVPAIVRKEPLDPSGLEIRGIILSRKNGVVLEDARSARIYFLSEGDRAGDIEVKKITKSTVTVSVNGKDVDLSILGGP